MTTARRALRDFCSPVPRFPGTVLPAAVLPAAVLPAAVLPAALILAGLLSACTESRTLGDGGPSDLDGGMCTVEDCVLTSRTCCGVCGAPTADDVIALRRDEVDAYRRGVCGPDPVGCPACATQPNPSLVAVCADPGCAVRDLGRAGDPATACTTDAGCVIRSAACCECGGGAPYLALAVDHAADYAALVCPPGTACPECAPLPPADLEAYCDASSGPGVCRIRAR